jgi:hypothetical protein
LLINTGNEATSRLIEVPKAVAGQSPAMRIEAVRGARYEITDPVLKSAPDVVRAKRVGKDLHVSLDDDDTAEFILEDYYEADIQTENAGLFGRAEDGTLSQYIPEDPVNSALTANLPDGGVATAQVLGVPAQEGFVLSALPLAAGGLGGWLAGGGALAAAAAADGGGGGGGGGGGIVEDKVTITTDENNDGFISGKEKPTSEPIQATIKVEMVSAGLSVGQEVELITPSGSQKITLTQALINQGFVEFNVSLPEEGKSLEVSAILLSNDTEIRKLGQDSATVDTTAAKITEIRIDEAKDGITFTEKSDGVQVQVTLPDDIKSGDKVSLLVKDPSGHVRTVDWVVTVESASSKKAEITIPLKDLSEDGNYQAEAIITDHLGNESESNSVDFLLNSMVDELRFSKATKDNGSGNKKVTDEGDIITYQIHFNEGVKIEGDISNIKLKIKIGDGNDEDTIKLMSAKELSADGKILVFEYEVKDKDFDHNGANFNVNSEDQPINFSPSLFLIGNVKILSAIGSGGLTASETKIAPAIDKGPLIDAIKRTSDSGLLIQGQKNTNGDWFYFRDNNGNGIIDNPDKSDGNAVSLDKWGDIDVKILENVGQIGGLQFLGWEDLNTLEAPADGRNVWVGTQLTNIGTGQVVGATQGYYFYQVI